MHLISVCSFALQVEGNANIRMKNPTELLKLCFMMQREIHKRLWLFISYSIQTVSGRLAKKIIQKNKLQSQDVIPPSIVK